MDRVLLITDVIHASPRIPGLARYLPEFGWQPIILTPAFNQRMGIPCRVIQTDCLDTLRLWKRLLKLSDDTSSKELKLHVEDTFGFANPRITDWLLRRAAALVTFPDGHRGWKQYAVRAANDVIMQERIGAIISSSSPVTSHIVARNLKKKWGLPWIADLRDLWTLNHNYRYGAFRKILDKSLEVQTLQTANCITTVSEPWADVMRLLHKNRRVFSITNGFDPAIVAQGPSRLSNVFTIVYTGAIYREKQNLSRFLSALRDLLVSKTVNEANLRVEFYGRNNTWLAGEIERYGLSSIVEQRGRVSYQMALEKQKASHLLLLFNWEDPFEKGVYPLKVFEYLGARRPILATGGYGDDVIEKLLSETKAGYYCREEAEIKEIIAKTLSEYELTGSVVYRGDQSKIDLYSYREMAKRFARLLDASTL